MSDLPDGYVRRNFPRAELQCKCGCGRMDLDDRFLNALQALRDAYGKPMVINSGYRCPQYNARVSTTGLAGPHTIGAVDVRVSGSDAQELLTFAVLHGWTGFGVKQHGAHSGRFLHLDRLGPRVWSYE